MASVADKLTWLASETGGPGWFRKVDRFQIGDVHFDCSFERGSEPNRFYIRKHRRQVEAFLAVLDRFPNANMVELGIMEGGSTALAALAGSPRKLVSLELEPERVAALDELVARYGLEKRVRPYYGVDQADRDRLRAIITEEFVPESLDLVIDDASHLLEPTRASFETLFPHLRKGGLYLIEDWKWQIRMATAVAEQLRESDLASNPELRRRLSARLTSGGRSCRSEHAKERQAPLPKLVMEFVLAKAESDEFVSEVTVGPWWVSVRRGNGSLDYESFRLADVYTDHLGLLPARNE